MNQIPGQLLILFLILVASSPSSGVDSEMNDVTNHLELVGKPLESIYRSGDQVYARNIWDLQVFDGRLYLGYGNSSNMPPAPNAGPVEVISYSPAKGHFDSEYKVKEEQISLYRIINGTLCIPGHDPTDVTSSVQFESTYWLVKNSWNRLRTLENVIHCYDIHEYGGRIFAALATRQKGQPAVVAASDDGCKTWVYERIEGQRAFSFFEIEGTLCTCNSNNDIFGYIDGLFRHIAATFTLLPDLKYSHAPFVIVRANNLTGKAIYIGAAITNAHQWKPIGLYTATSFKDVHRISLPGRPYDTLIQGGRCFVLFAEEEESSEITDRFIISVYQSNDLLRWTEVLRFRCSTFARSFEILEGDLYFGLGCDEVNLPESTGQILRIRKEYFSCKLGPGFDAQANP